MREWLMASAPIALVIYFVLYPNQFSWLLYEATWFLH